MKRISVFMLAMFFSLSLLAQEDTLLVEPIDSANITADFKQNYSAIPDSLEAYFMLDSAFTIDSRIGNTVRKNATGFFQVRNNEVIIKVNMYRYRQYFSFYGNIDGLNKLIDEEGRAVYQFYARGRGCFVGLVRSFEIILDPNGAILHYYNKLGNENVFYYTNTPSFEQIINFYEPCNLRYVNGKNYW